MTTKTNKITILGSGTSTGIPFPGCHCEVCSSPNPKNKRLRTSLFIETQEGRKILIDTPPDLRTQLLRAQIDSVDFVIITHDHADHLHGIDDLRPLSFGTPRKTIPLYADGHCSSSIKSRFSYIFPEQDLKPIGGGIPLIDLTKIPISSDQIHYQTINEEEFEFFLLPHGRIQTLCFIHNGFAYLPDCNSIPDQILTHLKQKSLKLLIIDCVLNRSHKTHLNVDSCFKYIDEIAPEQAGLIHMGHSLEHEQLEHRAKKELKTEVFVTYDSQQINY